jgi:hypothetical protein
VDCPHCKKDGAYTGLLWVHCQNSDCKYFDARYTQKIKDEQSEALQRAIDGLILLGGDVADPDDPD